ncbi:DUF402 domain-containing protein [Spiroplasma endosymbiont of Amphibalanus improvisus]|uniref:DUF402 domain-containing protein n=1 Tax=Spiroplasma endosymbiont of Amphibalanus improvisus TaxID=3066327 RepID=UPI00313B66BA
MQKTNVAIKAYKHDGSLHRMWNDGQIISSENNKLIIFNPVGTKVIEKNGKSWELTEPSLTFFYKDKWHNKVFIQDAENKIKIYINVTSLFQNNKNLISYIDYDYDFKVDSNGEYKLVDMYEFHRNRKKYNYSMEITRNILDEISNIKSELNENFETLINEAKKIFKNKKTNYS